MSATWLMLGDLLPLAAVIALSPLSILPAVLLVLHSARPAASGLAFLVGWLAALAACTGVFVEVPRLIGIVHLDPPTWVHWIGITLGVVLLAAAPWRWATRANAVTSSREWSSRIGVVTPAGSGLLGFTLPVLNVKVLLMCAGAGFAISTADLNVTEAWIAVAVFTAAAGSSVALPVLAYVVFSERLDVPIDSFKSWMQRNQAGLTAFTLTLIGALVLFVSLRGFAVD